MIKTSIYVVTIATILVSASSSSAACYADYKAKKSSPLQLHYGVVEIPNKICSNKAAIRKNIKKRISVGGWKLLNVMSVFGPEGLSRRQTSAGQYYLKF